MRSSVGSKWGMRASMRRWTRVACEASSRSEAEVAPEESKVSADMDLAMMPVRSAVSCSRAAIMGQAGAASGRDRSTVRTRSSLRVTKCKIWVGPIANSGDQV